MSPQTARSGTHNNITRAVSYLLQRMESFDGIAVLATNLRGNLDPAFARRLHFIITFPDPDAAIGAALEHHLPPFDARPEADTIERRTLGEAAEVSGGDIRNVVLASVYDAVARGEPVGMRHIADALSRELGKLGRRVTDISWLTNDALSDKSEYKGFDRQ